ncbi:MAG: hypothetical protein FWD67_00410 [Betaproteobacteria bacterium]|nr:hypothetical protein [Betaproteobacteria bacterium]
MFSAVPVFARRRITWQQQRAVFLAIIFVVFVAAVWGLNMRQIPVLKQPPAPDIRSAPRPPSDMANNVLPADSEPSAASVSEPLPLPETLAAPVPEFSTLSESSASPVPTVKDSQSHVNRISGLLASHHVRAVYSGRVNGKRRVKVEFLTEKGTVSDVYSEEALSRNGWKLSVNLDKRTAILRNTERVYFIPLVDNSYAKKSSKTVIRSKLTSAGDHVGVGYLKLKK